MSIISLRHEDQSDLLCKRFAYLASTYMDAPEQVRGSEAEVPLENLFRLLQMFRYNAFADSARPGVLALRGLVQPEVRIPEQTWHIKIEAALAAALKEAFGSAASKEDAIDEIQSSLRWLATNTDPPPQDALDRARTFMGKLITELD